MTRIILWAIGIWIAAYVILYCVSPVEVRAATSGFFNVENLVENHFILAIFGLLVGLIGYLLQRVEDSRERKEYEGWSVTVKLAPPEDGGPVGRSDYTKDLWWQEVRSFKESYFERRKFIQSVASSEGYTVLSGEIDITNTAGWVYQSGRNYVFDFSKAKSFDTQLRKN